MLTDEQAQDAMKDFNAKLGAADAEDPRLIFNAEQTVLFYAALPNRTFVVGEHRSLRGVKKMASKARITLMLAASASRYPPNLDTDNNCTERAVAPKACKNCTTRSVNSACCCSRALVRVRD